MNESRCVKGHLGNLMLMHTINITSWGAYSETTIPPNQNNVLISLHSHENFTDHVLFVDVSLNGYVGMLVESERYSMEYIPLIVASLVCLGPRMLQQGHMTG